MGAREDVVSSFRLAVTDEARLFGGGVVALVGYALWVGLSGAALTFGADAVNVSLAPTPWSGLKTGLVALALLAWLVAPAAVGAWLLVRHLTNASGNLAQRYRYRHPAALLVPPVALLVVVAAASLAVAGPPWPLFAVLVFAALFALVRVVAYGYRVFSLSVPRALAALAGLSLLPVGGALLTGGAVLAGRRAYLVGVLDGFGEAVGVPGLAWLAEGSVAVGNGTLPAAVAVAVAVPVGLSIAYIAVQTVASLVARVRNPEVGRGELRTGQRYPDFARPTAGSAPTTGSQPAATAPGSNGGGDDAVSAGPAQDGASSGSNTPVAAASGGAEGESEPEGEDAAVQEGPTVDTGPSEADLDDGVSNTRVYTPPGDDESEEDPLSLEEDDETPMIDFDEPASDAEAETEDDTEAEADAGMEADAGDDECPACGEPNDPDAAFCTTCGTALE